MRKVGDAEERNVVIRENSRNDKKKIINSEKPNNLTVIIPCVYSRVCVQFAPILYALRQGTGLRAHRWRASRQLFEEGTTQEKHGDEKSRA